MNSWTNLLTFILSLQREFMSDCISVQIVLSAVMYPVLLAGRIISLVLHSGVVITAGHDGHIRVHSAPSMLWVSTLVHHPQEVLRSYIPGLVQAHLENEGWSNCRTRGRKAAYLGISEQRSLQWWGWQGQELSSFLFYCDQHRLLKCLILWGCSLCVFGIQKRWLLLENLWKYMLRVWGHWLLPPHLHHSKKKRQSG